MRHDSLSRKLAEDFGVCDNIDTEAKVKKGKTYFSCLHRNSSNFIKNVKYTINSLKLNL